MHFLCGTSTFIWSWSWLWIYIWCKCCWCYIGIKLKINFPFFCISRMVRCWNILHKYFWYWLKQYKCVVWLFLWNMFWKKINCQSLEWFNIFFYAAIHINYIINKSYMYIQTISLLNSSIICCFIWNQIRSA